MRKILNRIAILAIAFLTAAAAPPEPGELEQALTRFYALDWGRVSMHQAREIWPVELTCLSDTRKTPEAKCDGTVTLTSHYLVRDGDCFSCDTLVFSHESSGSLCTEQLISVSVRRLFDSEEKAMAAARRLSAPLREIAAKDEDFHEEEWSKTGGKSVLWWQRIPLKRGTGEVFEITISKSPDGWVMHLHLSRVQES